MSGHLGYDKGAPESSAFANSRNGHTPKTIATQVGDVDLAVPYEAACEHGEGGAYLRRQACTPR